MARRLGADQIRPPCGCKNGGRVKRARRSSPTPSCRRSRTTTSPGRTSTRTSPTPRWATTARSREPRSLITGEPMKIEWGPNWDDNLGGAPEHGSQDPIVEQDPRGGRREDQLRVRADLHVLSAADLRALPEPGVRGVLPVGRDVQARRGRHRPRRPGPLPGLADVRHRLPVQEGLLQPPHRQGREVHDLLPARRGRAADRLLGDVRGPPALPRRDPLRRRQGDRGRLRRGRTRRCTRPSWRSSSTRTTRRCGAAAARPGSPTTGSRRPAAPPCTR